HVRDREMAGGDPAGHDGDAREEHAEPGEHESPAREADRPGFLVELAARDRVPGGCGQCLAQDAHAAYAEDNVGNRRSNDGHRAGGKCVKGKADESIHREVAPDLGRDRGARRRSRHSTPSNARVVLVSSEVVVIRRVGWQAYRRFRAQRFVPFLDEGEEFPFPTPVPLRQRRNARRRTVGTVRNNAAHAPVRKVEGDDEAAEHPKYRDDEDRDAGVVADLQYAEPALTLEGNGVVADAGWLALG